MQGPRIMLATPGYSYCMLKCGSKRELNWVPAMRDALSSETGRVEFEILGKGRAVRN